MNRIDEQHGPHQRPMGRVEHRFGRINLLSAGALQRSNTQSSQDAGQNEIDAHRSHHPHQIVHPRAKTKDSQILLGFVRTFFDHIANIEDECHHIDDRVEEWHEEAEACMQWIQVEFRTSEMIEKNLQQ